jgi:hypothetical protein
MNDIWQQLKAPFPPDIVSWRVGATKADKTKGMALAYIDARDVAERLDNVLGPENWQCDYPHAGSKTVCRIGVRIGDDWVWKADGAGDTDHEAEKGALSDAFKRAAVRFGVGRYLYDVKNSWVEIEKYGNSYKIADGEFARLRKMLPSPNNVVSLPSIHNDTKTNTRDDFKQLCKEVNDIASLAELRLWKTNQINIDRMEKLNGDLADNFTNTFKDKVAELKRNVAA